GGHDPVERLILICLGGALGTGLRYLASGLAARWLGADFPYGTLIVNVVGSFLIGLIQEIGTASLLIHDTTRLFLTGGIMGGVARFCANSVIHTSAILRLSEGLPLVIEVVDSAEHLEALLPEVDRLLKGGLITMEKVRVLRYAPDEKGLRPPSCPPPWPGWPHETDEPAASSATI